MSKKARLRILVAVFTAATRALEFENIAPKILENDLKFDGKNLVVAGPYKNLDESYTYSTT
jgi:hypothetical protein